MLRFRPRTFIYRFQFKMVTYIEICYNIELIRLLKTNNHFDFDLFAIQARWMSLEFSLKKLQTSKPNPY